MAKDATRIGNRVIPAGKTQIGVNVEDLLLGKLRAIAEKEAVSYAEVYNLAFQKFVEAYEAKNGKVKIQEKGKGLKNL